MNKKKVLIETLSIGVLIISILTVVRFFRNLPRPEEKIAVNNLKSILPPLEGNELGMCPICAKLLGRNWVDEYK